MMGRFLQNTCAPVWHLCHTGAVRTLNRGRFLRSFITALILCLVTVVAGFGRAPAAVCAAGTCNGLRYYFSGVLPAGPAYGADAYINRRIPALCTGGASHSASSAWVMVMGGGYYQYAQIGYVRFVGQSNVEYFTQYQQGAGYSFVHKQNWGVVDGPHRYSVTYDRTVGRMRMLRDGVTLETTNFDPMLGWTPNWHVEWQAEVHDYGDDMVGTAASPARFTNLKWQLTVGGPWATPTGLWGQSNNSHYAFEWETADKFRVWTR